MVALTPRSGAKSIGRWYGRAAGAKPSEWWFREGALVRVRDDWAAVTAMQRFRGGWGEERRAVMGRVAQVREDFCMQNLVT
jgi:hypothetical protein